MATFWENSCSFGLRYVSWYKYLIVSLVFSHLGFWSGNLFLIAPFPDLCLLVPSYSLELETALAIMVQQSSNMLTSQIIRNPIGSSLFHSDFDNFDKFTATGSVHTAHGIML